MGSRPLRPELERQYSRFGSFPGLEARGAAFQEPWPEAGPKLGAVPKISFQRPPWSLGCSPQPGPLPYHQLTDPSYRSMLIRLRNSGLADIRMVFLIIAFIV